MCSAVAKLFGPEPTKIDSARQHVTTTCTLVDLTSSIIDTLSVADPDIFFLIVNKIKKIISISTLFPFI